LAMNLSPPVLHLFKLLQTPAWHGPTAFGKGLYRYGKALGQKALDIQGPERQALELYVRLPALIRAVEQSPGMANALKPAMWRKLGTGLTTLIEHFDNGVNLMAAIERGAAAGVSPNLIHKVNLDTLMRLNFRGYNFPNAVTSTTGRVAFMYMGQPGKLMENKVDLLWKSLRGERDEYGRLYLNKAIRLAVLLGGAYAAGQMADVDLLRHVLHPPGLQPSKDTGEYTLSFKTPPIQLAADLADKGPIALWQHFTQIPSLDRLLQAANDEVGLKYDDSVKQMLGLPKSGWHEELIDRKRIQQLRRDKRSRGGKEKMKSPTQRFLEEKFSDLTD
jgi:hypothetical protein